MRSLASRHRTTLALAACWAGSTAVLAVLPDPAVEQVLRRASTTLPRLASWPWTLPASGLLVREDLAVWLLALLLGAAQVERAVGWRRTAVLLVAVHAGATVLSQALLGARVALGRAPADLLDQVDVGPSYLAVAGLAAAVLVAPAGARRLLPAAALLVGLPELLEGLGRADLAATGHVAALALGLAGGGLLELRAPRRPRCQTAAWSPPQVSARRPTRPYAAPAPRSRRTRRGPAVVDLLVGLRLRGRLPRRVQGRHRPDRP